MGAVFAFLLASITGFPQLELSMGMRGLSNMAKNGEYLISGLPS
jgi:hypothetical protein